MLKLFGGRKPGLVGLDISASAIKLLELSRDDGGYVVESYGVEPLPENTVVEQNIVDVEAVAEAIKRLQASTQFKSKLDEFDSPMPRCDIDQTFIVILAGKDIDQMQSFLNEKLSFSINSFKIMEVIKYPEIIKKISTPKYPPEKTRLPNK